MKFNFGAGLMAIGLASTVVTAAPPPPHCRPPPGRVCNPNRQLLVNPLLTPDLAGWHVTGIGGIIRIPDCQDGFACAQFNLDDVRTLGQFSQQVDGTIAGAHYKLTFQYATKSGSARAAQVYVYDGPISAIKGLRVLPIGQDGTGAGSGTFTGYFEAASATTTIIVQVDTQTEVDFRVFDFALVESCAIID